MQISNFDDKFLASVKELFIKNTCDDYYRIHRDDAFISKFFKGSYKLMINKGNISQIIENLSKILIFYLNLSKLDDTSDFIKLIKSVVENLKGLPQNTKQVVWKILDERIFRGQYGIVNSYIKLRNLENSEKNELQELKMTWDQLN